MFFCYQQSMCPLIVKGQTEYNWFSKSKAGKTGKSELGTSPLLLSCHLVWCCVQQKQEIPFLQFENFSFQLVLFLFIYFFFKLQVFFIAVFELIQIFTYFAIAI